MKSGCIHYEPIFPLSFITEIIKINHPESTIVHGLKAGGWGSGGEWWDPSCRIHPGNIFVHFRQWWATNLKTSFFFVLCVRALWSLSSCKFIVISSGLFFPSSKERYYLNPKQMDRRWVPIFRVTAEKRFSQTAGTWKWLFFSAFALSWFRKSRKKSQGHPCKSACFNTLCAHPAGSSSLQPSPDSKNNSTYKRDVNTWAAFGDSIAKGDKGSSLS